MSAKPLAVFDIDGTIFRSSLLIEVTSALVAQGSFPSSAAAEFDAPYVAWRQRQGSYEAYIRGVVGVFEKYLAGLAPVELDRAADSVIESTAAETYRYTRDLITALQPDHHLVAISQSPSQLVERFAARYGFDDYRATTYTLKDGHFTGHNDANARTKRQILDDVVQDGSHTLAGSIAVGDSESDISMLEAVEKPIAFNPNSLLFAEAAQRGWQIVVERKDVIYYYNADQMSTEHA